MVSLLEARGLSFSYPDGVVALTDVDVDIRRGELVCALGPNGSGKSTLLKLLTGILRPSSGAITIEGVALERMRTRERARRIAAVPQVLAALPDADVESFVLGGRYSYLQRWGRPRGGDFEAVERALQEADAARWKGRHLGELSGGECQRVLVARALAQESDLLLFDEPTSALDPEHQVRLFELIARLAGDGRGALVATHELALAGRFADRILLLDGGRLVATGTPEQVFRPSHLEAMYGSHLFYGTGPGPGGTERPMVIPWPRAQQDPT